MIRREKIKAEKKRLLGCLSQSPEQGRFDRAEQLARLSQNCLFENVCSSFRKACFSQVIQKLNKYLVSYESNSRTSICRPSYLLSTKSVWNHDWFTSIFIFSESPIGFSSARFLGDTYLFLWAVQLWVRIFPRLVPSPSFKGKILWADLIPHSPGESLRMTLLVRAATTLFSQGSSIRHGSAGQICIPNAGPIHSTIFLCLY